MGTFPMWGIDSSRYGRVEVQPVKFVLVPILLMMSAVMMALAWLGHLRFEDSWSFWVALAVSWALVLPEYALNTAATRWGYGVYSGAQMAAIHLSSGVVCVALVSHFILNEVITTRQFVGLGLMLVSILLILSKREDLDEAEARVASWTEDEVA